MMTATWRLLGIEFRRSLGLWLAVPLLAIALWTSWEFLGSTIWLWTETSTALRNSTILLGPMVSALSAWVAGRERRHRLGDLLATVPGSVTRRTIAAWAGTAGWGVLVYVGAVFALGVITALNATWGRPSVPVILVGLASIVAHSAIGFAIGYWVSWRLTAPLVGITLFVARGVVAYNPSAIEYLAPVPSSEMPVEVFYRPNLEILLAQIVWLLGLTAVALTASVLPLRRTLRHLTATAGAILIAAAGCVILILSDGESLRGADASYTPVCEESRITVCLHPAYEPMLDETVGLIDRLIAPIDGVPGAPARAEQTSARDASDGWSGETLVFELLNTARDPSVYGLAGYNSLAGILVQDLVNIERSWHPPGMKPGEQRPKEVVGNWLLIQAGIPLEERIDEFRGSLHGFQLDEEQEAALERFSDLEDGQRRAWLEENWSKLRAGQLTLDDLP